jgi:hypothetical protein
VSEGFSWDASSTVSSHKEYGVLATLEAAKLVAEAAKARMGSSKTVLTVTTPDGAIYKSETAPHGAPVVWTRVN